MLHIEATDIADVKIISPKKFSDARGFFSEVHSRRDFAAAGIDLEFVQDNHVFSADKGTLRGLHFQIQPYAQDKLVRVTRGRILDVAVDLRRSSVHFGRHVAVELSAENWRQLLVPIGFAHGYVTLEPNTEVLYKVSNYYAPECDRGLSWDDPALGISWGTTSSISSEELILSDKDRKNPLLADLKDLFD